MLLKMSHSWFAIILVIVILVILIAVSFLASLGGGQLNDLSLHPILVEMDRLWQAQAFWTRAFSVETEVSYECSNSTSRSLFRNGKALGENLGKIYGKEDGKKYACLLKEHNEITTELLELSRCKRHTEEVVKRWFKNGDEISYFLSKVNPRICFHTMRDLMKAYLESMLETIHRLLNTECSEASASFESAKRQAGEVAAYIIHHT